MLARSTEKMNSNEQMIVVAYMMYIITFHKPSSPPPTAPPAGHSATNFVAPMAAASRPIPANLLPLYEEYRVTSQKQKAAAGRM